MAERISKQILEVEYKTTGDISPSIVKLESLQQAAKEAQGDTLKLVEAENKLRNAAIEAGKAVETQTVKQTGFQKSISETGKAMNSLAQTSKLKEAFTGSAQQIQSVNDALKRFEQTARSAKSVDELTQSVNELMDALPTDVRDEAIKLLDKEFGKLDKTIERPTARLRELKRLIATTDDPVLLRRYNEEAARLTDQLGDNQDLIKALASDTFFTDSLVESAQLAVSGFTAFQGALALVSEDQEELARAAQKAQGALALLQGTQTLLNELKKQDNVLTRAQIISQKIYTAAVGEATGAQKAFRLALLATGIGALVVGIGLLAANWDKVKAALTGTTEQQKRVAELQSKINENISDERIELSFLIDELDNSNTSQERRKEILDQIQKDYPGYLKNVALEGAAYDQTRQQLDNLVRALELKEKIEAATELRKNKRREALEAETKSLEDYKGTIDNILEGALPAFAEIPLEALGIFSANENAKESRKEFVEGLDADIKFLTEKIKQYNAELSTLGDPTQTEARGGSSRSAEASRKAVIGSIEFFQDRVTELSRKLNQDLVANSQEFLNTIPLLKEAQTQLDEAKKALGEPTSVELITAGSLNALKKQAAELEAIINNLPEGDELLSQVDKLKAVQQQIESLQSIISGRSLVEDKRASLLELLNEDEKYQVDSAAIAERGEIEKLRIQIRFAKARLDLLKQQGASEIEVIAASNQLDLLNQQLVKAQDAIVQNNKLTTEQLVQGFTQVIESAVNATQQVLSAKAQENAGLIALQEDRVARALEIAETGNAQVLQLEQQRLDDLRDKQERFARAQIEIATAQLVAQSTLAIARAAAEGGAFAPFTIGATLIALAAGLASARQQAQAIGAGQSFRKGGIYEGGYTGAGDPNSESTALGWRPYTYHKNEHIMPSEVVSIGRNKSILEDIRLKRLDISKMIGSNETKVIVNNDNKDVVKAIEKIPGVRFEINKDGLIKVVESRVSYKEKRNRIKNK